MNSLHTNLNILSVLALVVFTFSIAVGQDFKPEIIEALNDNDTSQVLILLDNNIKIDAAYAPNYLLKAQIFYARGQNEEALELLETALKKKSKLYEALYLKGRILLELERVDEAEKDFEKGLKKAKKEKALFHNGMGLVLMQRKEYSNADIEFRKAIQTGPDQPEFHVNLGDANFFSEIYALAISEYNQVIELDTTYLDVYFRLARAYVAQKQYGEALDQLSIVLSRDTMYAYAWKETGRLYTLAGLSARDQETKKQRFIETIGSYRKFLELTNDSTDGEVFYNMGRAYYNLGGYAPADSAFSIVLDKGDTPNGIYLYVGRSKIVLEQYQEGIDYLLKQIEWLKTKADENGEVWEPGPADADIYRRLGDAYKALDDNTTAAANYVIASDLIPQNARYAIMAAISYHQNQSYADALSYYERRIEIGPDDAGVYMNASGCTLELEEYEKSIDYLLKVVELDTTKTRAYKLLSDTYFKKLGDCDNGILWTEKLYQMDTTNCDALITLGFGYFGGDCYDNNLKAISYFRRALNCFKNKGMENCGNSNIMLYMAQAYHLHGANLLENDKKEESKTYFKNAFDWYNKVLKCDPNNVNAKTGKRDTEFEF